MSALTDCLLLVYSIEERLLEYETDSSTVVEGVTDEVFAKLLGMSTRGLHQYIKQYFKPTTVYAQIVVPDQRVRELSKPPAARWKKR